MIAVRILRQLLRCSQQEFARLSGLSTRELVRIETSEVLPRKDAVAGIDQAFHSLILTRMKEGTDGQG